MQSLNLMKSASKPLAPALLRRISGDDLLGEALPAAVTDLEGAVAALNDARRLIEKQEEQIRTLESMALTDELTGLLNRRGFGLALQRELTLARRDMVKGGVLIMADLDGFKTINDVFGHTTGDSYLQAVAEVLVTSIRASDLVGRLGGDEFALIFTGMDTNTGLKRLERLEKAFNGRQVQVGGRKFALQASFGLVGFTGNDMAEALFAAADLKLYAHKARRRGTLAS